MNAADLEAKVAFLERELNSCLAIIQTLGVDLSRLELRVDGLVMGNHLEDPLGDPNPEDFQQ